MRGRRLSRILRALVAIYPAPFRRDFGDDVVDTHVDRYRDARRRGRRAALVCAVSAFADLCWGAAHEWTAAGRDLWRARRADRPAQSPALHDLRLAARSLRRHPVFALTVVITLALGIGANTAAFSLIDAVLLRPLPALADPASLVAVYDAGASEASRGGVPFPTFRSLAAGNRTLQSLAAYTDEDVALQTPGRSALVPVTAVSGEYFATLGVSPRLGRLIESRDDESPLASPVVVISERVWAREFDGNPHALGHSVRLGPTSFTVIGVAPRGFRGTHLSRSPDFWVPLTMVQGLDLGGFLSGRFSRNLFTTFRGFGWLQLVGRLRPGVSVDAAAADLTRLVGAGRPASASGERRESPVKVVPISSAATIEDRIGLLRFMSLLLGVVALILLLACLNVATLLLVRADERARELGVCAALGASRPRLVRTLFTEAILLATCGGAGGLALGLLATRAWVAFTLPGSVAIDGLDLSLDPRVLAFASLLTIATTLVFGLAPAVRASRTDPALAFRYHLRAATGSASRVGLLAAQVAISVVILVVAALFLRSLRAGLTTHLGFDPQPITAASIELRLHGYSYARAAAFYRQLVDRLHASRGIEAAAIASHVPLAPVRLRGVRAEGAPASAPGVRVGYSFVTPGYFRALGVPILAGRDFSAADTPKAPLVVVLSASAARALWTDGRAVGRHLLDVDDREYTVIGIVADTQYESLGGVDPPFLFSSILQEPAVGRVTVLARGSGAVDLPELLPRTVRDVDPLVAPIDVRPLSAQVEALLAPQRFGSVLLTSLGTLAVLIAAVGVYASLAYTVAQRRKEVGIRIALGAARTDVVRLVLRWAAAVLTVGVGSGLIVSVLAARGVAHFLVGVTPLDATAYAAATLGLASILGLVCLLPAYHASRVNPVHTLRGD